jgi:hypothetical protein
MHTDIVGLTAVIMILGIPMAAMYSFYRVHKLRTERIERFPCSLSWPKERRSRRYGILLTAGAIGLCADFRAYHPPCSGFLKLRSENLSLRNSSGK